MEVRFIAKESTAGDSPTLYATDRDSFLVQGYLVTDPEVRASLNIPEDDTCVEIYARLLSHLSKEGFSGTVTAWVPPVVRVLSSGNLVVQGKRVTDCTARATLAMPSHEDCVEVDRSAFAALFQEDAGHGAANRSPA